MSSARSTLLHRVALPRSFNRIAFLGGVWNLYPQLGIYLWAEGASPTRTRPSMPFFYYHGRTSCFFAYADENDLAHDNIGFRVSQFEHKRQTQTFDAQIGGMIRAFLQGGSYSTSKGFFSDVSAPNEKIVALSGFFGMVNYVAVGKDNDTMMWSGLSTSMTNYLWACLVEEDRINGFRSSRRFGDWDPVSTTTPVVPSGREGILVASYTSGEPINDAPEGSFVMPTVASHAAVNTDPHGPSMFQTALVVQDLVSNGSYRTSPGVPQYYNAPVLASSGVAFAGVDFSEAVKFIDGSRISQRTHLHAVTSGLQYMGAAPSNLLVTEKLSGTGTIQYDQHGGHNVGVLSGVDAITRTHFNLLVPEGFRAPESFTLVHGRDGATAASVTAKIKDTAGSILNLITDARSGFPTTTTVPVPAGTFAEGAPMEVQLVLSGNVGDAVRFGPWSMRYHAKNS